MSMHSLKRAVLSLTAFFYASSPHAESGAPAVAQPPQSGVITSNDSQRSGFGHLGVDDQIQNILRHPAFAGFSRLLLPWDGRSYDEQMSLRQIGELLPYHSHIEPRIAVAALNRMIDDAASGHKVFHDIYTPAQKQADPAKQRSGLFFYRGKPGAPFAIIAPGGGFAYVGSLHEGFPYAMEISQRGYNALVLKYRTGLGGQAATEDLAAAISYIHENHAELQVDTKNYSAWGSSAGARMVASIGSHGLSRYGGGDFPKPSVVVMAYTSHSDHSGSEPPTFAIVGSGDGISPPAAMDSRVKALRSAGTEVQFRIVEGVGHGFGLGGGTGAEGWVGDAVQFWEKVIRRKR